MLRQEKSVFYMIESNPGAGTRNLYFAYMFFSKDKKTKDSAPGALIIHLFGGIHEIYFPYVLMNPLLLFCSNRRFACSNDILHSI